VLRSFESTLRFRNQVTALPTPV